MAGVAIKKNDGKKTEKKQKLFCFKKKHFIKNIKKN